MAELAKLPGALPPRLSRITLGKRPGNGIFLATGCLCFLAGASPIRAQTDSLTALGSPPAADVNPEIFMVVTPTREQTPLLESPTTVQVISGSDLDAAGIRTVGEALTRLSSEVQFAQGGVGSFFSIRGYSSSSNFNERELILLDGQPLNDAALATFPLEAISTVNVDHIEIVAGPGSALYGPDAFAGVINIITRRPGDVRQDAGDLYLQSNGVTVEGVVRSPHPTDQAARSPGISWTVDGMYNRDPGPARDANTNVRGGEVHARFAFPHALDLSLGYFANDAGSPGIAFQSPPTPHNRLQVNIGTAQLIWRPPVKRADMQVRFYGETGNERARSELPIGSGVYHYLAARPGTYGVEMQAHMAQGRQNSLLLGADLRSLTSRGDVNDNASNLAVFGQEELRFGRFSPSLGIRYDQHSIYGGHLSPRLAGIYRVSNQVYLRGSLGQAFRAPNFLELDIRQYVLNRELFPGGPSIPIVITGNRSLQPEETTAGEIGVRANLPRDFTIDAAAFDDRVKKLISFLIFVPPPAPGAGPGGTWANTGTQRIRGMDFTVTHALGRNARTSLQYVYLDASHLSLSAPNAVALSGLAPHHAVSWQTYANRLYGMDAALIVNARSRSESMGSAAEADVTLGRQINSRFRVQLIGQNVLDSQYEVGGHIPARGRTFFLRLTGNLE